jgi:hypothetical protein
MEQPVGGHRAEALEGLLKDLFPVNLDCEEERAACLIGKGLQKSFALCLHIFIRCGLVNLYSEFPCHVPLQALPKLGEIFDIGMVWRWRLLRLLDLLRCGGIGFCIVTIKGFAIEEIEGAAAAIEDRSTYATQYERDEDEDDEQK